MDAQHFAAEARDLDLRTIAVHGAVSGLFFAQTLAWQEVVDTVLVEVVGVSPDDTVGALGRAALVTLLTTGATWAIVVACRRRPRPTA